MATYLVTGGAGFIGHHLVRALVSDGNRVRIVDNFFTGKRERVHPNAELIEADIRDIDALRDACAGVDGIFHLAALPRVQFSIEQPLVSNAVNITGTLNVLEAARAAGVRRVIYSASSAAYGDQEVLPIREDAPIAPKSPYGLQKYVGEGYCTLVSLCHGLETASLRYFNAYGPGMSAEGAYATVIAVFLQQRSEGTPLTITGDGTQTRDFTHVRDIVRANLLAMTSPNVGRGEVMNIGSGTRQSVREVARAIGGPVQHIAPRIEPHDTLADIRRARELIGWEPQVAFADGIAELLQLARVPERTGGTKVRS